MVTSEQINEIAAALSKAQGEMRPAAKDATNPHFRSKYADLAANVEAAREPLAKHGIAVVQEPTTTERGVAVTTLLLHSSGQWIKLDPLTVPMSKSDAHGVGSATTYARRYSLGGALGLVAEDDDGNAATQRPNGSSRAIEPSELPAAFAPAGYFDWLTDLTAVADTGAEALKAAWTKSKAEYRRHLTTTNNALWESLKARAAIVKVAS